MPSGPISKKEGRDLSERHLGRPRPDNPFRTRKMRRYQGDSCQKSDVVAEAAISLSSEETDSSKNPIFQKDLADRPRFSRDQYMKGGPDLNDAWADLAGDLLRTSIRSKSKAITTSKIDLSETSGRPTAIFNATIVHGEKSAQGGVRLERHLSRLGWRPRLTPFSSA
eukprot:GEMP01061390.1.p1 GENE.GEMP01061390.1~~GEMP01061390.1.p1  ORF type:complete len:167 (-),score=23.50 GEMP01061390.1:465-965(-)